MKQNKTYIWCGKTMRATRLRMWYLIVSGIKTGRRSRGANAWPSNVLSRKTCASWRREKTRCFTRRRQMREGSASWNRLPKIWFITRLLVNLSCNALSGSSRIRFLKAVCKLMIWSIPWTHPLKTSPYPSRLILFRKWRRRYLNLGQSPKSSSRTYWAIILSEKTYSAS